MTVMPLAEKQEQTANILGCGDAEWFDLVPSVFTPLKCLATFCFLVQKAKIISLGCFHAGSRLISLFISCVAVR